MGGTKSIVYMILSVIAFSFMNTLVKYLNDFGTYQLLFFRSIGTLCFTVPLLLKTKVAILGNNKLLLLSRGVAGVVSLTCFFQSLNYLPLGTSVSLRYTSPIFAAIFAFLFLKEKIKPIQWVLFLIAFSGVVLIKGFGGNVNSIGLFFIMMSAVSLGVIFVLIRKMGGTENPLVIINYFMVMSFVFGGVMSIGTWKNPIFIEWIILLSLGVFGYVGQLYLTKAFQSDETSVIAPLKYLEVVFMIVIGAFWFGESYNLWTLLGVVLIMIGLIYNVYVKKSQR